MDAQQRTSLLAAGVSCGRPYAATHTLPATLSCSAYAIMQQQHLDTIRATAKAIGRHEVGRPWHMWQRFMALAGVYCQFEAARARHRGLGC